MAYSQIKRYIWLVDTIASAKKITREQIDSCWAKSKLNTEGEQKVHDRTFFRSKNEIEELFGIKISSSKEKGKTYYFIEGNSAETDVEYENQVRQFASVILNKKLKNQKSPEQLNQIVGVNEFESEPQIVRINALTEVADILRSQPLHKSQNEQSDSTFNWQVPITPNFVQQLRAFGSGIEVLEPQSLREVFENEALRLSQIY